MKYPVVTCAICNEPICMEMPDRSDGLDPAHLRHEFEAVAEEHLRTHPQPVHARFWLRRFLDDISPGERALAVKQIYNDLRELWGEQDSRGVYTIDEALGTPSLYRLWLAANRCSYRACKHAAESPSDCERSMADNRASIRWHRQLLGRILPPPEWKGTSREWRELSSSVIDNCTCASTGTHSTCSAHALLNDWATFNRLLFGRRMASRLQREEFMDLFAARTSTADPATATHK